MEYTIIPGDNVLISKLSYGPRLPSSPFEIPWVNIAFYLNKKYRIKVDSVLWKYKRFKGVSIIKHGEVVVFNSPRTSKEILIKRCMGLPGDSLLIRDEKVYANRREVPEEGTVKMISRIIFTNNALASSLFDSLGLKRYHSRPGGENYFSAPLNNNQIKKILKFKFIESIVIEKERPDTAYNTFPHSSHFRWSIDNFGPLVIPSKGMTIKLNEENYEIYNDVIKHFEMTNITTSGGEYFLNGVKTTSFTFKNNYYFMLGDNRHDSNDSRYWGFVPESYIIGRAVLVLFSNGEDGFRWNRLFKIIK